MLTTFPGGHVTYTLHPLRAEAKRSPSRTRGIGKAENLVVLEGLIRRFVAGRKRLPGERLKIKEARIAPPDGLLILNIQQTPYMLKLLLIYLAFERLPLSLQPRD